MQDLGLLIERLGGDKMVGIIKAAKGVGRQDPRLKPTGRGIRRERR